MFDAAEVAGLLADVHGLDFGMYGARTAADVAELVALAVRALDLETLERAGFDGSVCGSPRQAAPR